MTIANIQLPLRPSQRGEPAWEVFDHLPAQGEWSVDLYLRLPQDGRFIEYNDGFLEVLPLPTWLHNKVAYLLCIMLDALRVDGTIGKTSLPPFNLRTWGRAYRLPDLVYLLPKNAGRFSGNFWDYADLVFEVVSKDDPDRDYVTKRAEYARAGIPEYWIVDIEERRIVVLTLEGKSYCEAGTYPAGTAAKSIVVPGFEADLGQLIAQANS